jgi:hypothetical protein
MPSASGKSIAIVTALCGDREKLSDPSIVHDCADYFAFVDRPHPNTKIWQQRPTWNFSDDPRFTMRRNAKFPKIMMPLVLPGYQFYFWADVSHDVVADPMSICRHYLATTDIAVFRHTARNCAYSEATEINKLNYDHVDKINSQVAQYRADGFPEDFGLFELSTFVLRGSHRMAEFGLRWWDQICRFSSRDQISFPYVLWKTGTVPSILAGFANGYNSRGTIGNNELMPQVREHIGAG